MTGEPKSFANTTAFYSTLGAFYSTWTTVDLMVDLAIGKLLKLPPEQTHALVASLEFGRKAALLRSLLTISDYKNADQLKGYLKRITKESLRNVFTHSFMASDEHSVTFVHRSSQGEYSATGYYFTALQFIDHVQGFASLAIDFQKGFGFSNKDIGDFAAAAIKQ